MDEPEPTGHPPDEPSPGQRPFWLRLVRVILVLALVGLAFMAFASWYFTNTLDFVFGPPR